MWKLFIYFTQVMMTTAVSSLARILGEGHSFPAHAFVVVVKWGSVREHRFHFLGKDQSTLAQRAKTTVAECSLTSCVRAGFPARFIHYTWTAQPARSDFVG